MKKKVYIAMSADVLHNGHINIINEGVAEGIVVGGNLSLIYALMGTPYEINFDDKILFIEEVNEAPYAVDRMLSSLILSGKLKTLKGIICGYFTGCSSTENQTFWREQLRRLSPKN